MSRYSFDKCQRITELCSGPHYMQNEYPRQCFAQERRMTFEGHELCMPADYDTYLRMAFGDYTQLPPPEERICHHEYEVLDPEHSYRVYRGKAYGCRP